MRDLRFRFADGGRELFHGLSLTIRKGERIGIRGASGAGKTTLFNLLLGLYEPSGGEIAIDGTPLTAANRRAWQNRIGYVSQNLFIADGSFAANVALGIPAGEVDRERVMQALRAAQLGELVTGLAKGIDTHVGECGCRLSGGQRQRIGIARALVMEPEFIVADEPISALDVSIRAQVLNLLNSMKKSRGLTYLFIAHDLSVVRFISDRIAVISKGRIVELAEAEELFLHPLHPYTKALLSAVPIPDPGLEKKKKLLVYDPSCHDYSVDKPVWEEIANGHFVYGNQKELEGYRKEYQSQL